jgi:hypothetical protein
MRIFKEESNFRRFAATTKTLDNYINMHNLDDNTREVISYYQKLTQKDNGKQPQPEKNPISPKAPLS